MQTGKSFDICDFLTLCAQKSMRVWMFVFHMSPQADILGKAVTTLFTHMNVFTHTGSMDTWTHHRNVDDEFSNFFPLLRTSGKFCISLLVYKVPVKLNSMSRAHLLNSKGKGQQKQTKI